jgi:hypothetical protein
MTIAINVHVAMEALKSELEGKFIGREYAGNRHIYPSRVVRVIPPTDPKDYSWLVQWRVELRPKDKTKPPTVNRLTTVIGREELRPIFKRHFPPR